MIKRIINKLFLVKEIRSKKGLLHFRRWRLLATPWFSIFIHEISRRDEDEDPHSHPWNFRTLVLRGGYEKICYKNGRRTEYNVLRRWETIKHTKDEYHRIMVLRDIRPVWTLVVVGKRDSEWGYLTEKGCVDKDNYRKMKNG